MAFYLTNFYVQTGATRSDIKDSVADFSATVGVVPDPGSMTATLTYPVLDTAGSAVTITKGMTIWPYYYQATPSIDDCVPFAGVITDVKQTGDLITVTAESLLAPIMRGTFSGTYAALDYVYEIFNDVIASFTPAAPFLISGSYGVYRAVTGGSQVAVNVQVDDLEFANNTIGAIGQYFAELLPNTTLTSNLSTVYPTYYTDPGTGKASVYLTYTGYGNHALTAVLLSYDAGLLSTVDWSDATDSVLNDVTVTIKGDASYQKTDAASITAYGQRETKLFRPMYYTNTTYAQKHADSMVANLKDPKSRCKVDIEADYVLAWGSVNGVYTITDDITGKSEEMVLRSFTLEYPADICHCEFDNAALNLSNYGVRLENRVANLESNLVTAHAGFFDLQGGQSGQYYHLNQSAYNNLYQQDQTVKIASTPTFASVTSTGDVSVGDELRITTDTSGTIKARDILYFKDSDSVGEAQYIDMVSAAHTIAGSTQHASANLNLNRGADVNGWDHWIYWKRYGAVGASTPNWRLGRTGAQEPLRFQYTADDATFSDALIFEVDGGLTLYKMRTSKNDAMDNIYVGDDAFIGDGGVADRVFICGQTAAAPNANGGVVFGSGKDTNIYRGGANLLSTDDSFYSAINISAAGAITAAGAVTGTLLRVGTSAASDTVQMENNAASYNDTSTYVRVKGIRIRRDIIGACRVKYTQDTVAGTGTAYAQYYVNGVAVGTEYSSTSTDDTARSEDISGSLRAGDVLGVYAKTSGTRLSYVKDFKICFTDTASTTDYDVV